MAINFPASPTTNQTYTYNGRTWTYNGVGWQATGSTGLTVYTKTNFTATAGQTSFSCTYTVGFVDVYYNGSKLSTSEYTATTGSTVVLGTACAVGDIVETIAWTISSSFNPSLGSASATSLALGGATIGSNALAVTGTSTFSSTVTHSGATTLSGALTYGGVALSNAVTGTGNMVLSAAPTLTGITTGVTFSTDGFSNGAGTYEYRLRAGYANNAAGGSGLSAGDPTAAGFNDSAVIYGARTIGMYTGQTLRAVIDSSGRLGIGMTPSNILDITQNQNAQSIVKLLNSNGSSSAQAYFNASNGTTEFRAGMLGTGATQGSAAAGEAFVYSNNNLSVQTAGALKFAAGGIAEKARIGSDGSFLVGTTTNSGAGTISVKSSSGGGVINSTQLAAGDYCYNGVAFNNGGSYYFMAFSGGTGGSIINNGTVTVYATTSDERVKDWAGVVQSDKRQMISDLWLGDFDIYDDFTKTGTPNRGFGVRAQQAYAVLGSQFGLSPPANETDRWNAPSEPFGFLALWGVKDLYAENEALRARVAALEARLTALENK